MKNIDFNEIYIFIKVVQSGSFTKAAQELQTPISTVSSKVSSLEKRLGITLIQRTTRQLKLTPAGNDYYQNTLSAFNHIVSTEENATSTLSEPQGVLTITAPVYLGGLLFPEILKELKTRHPKLKINVLLKDETVDLVAEGIDVAIRAGDLKDSSLISKKIGSTHFMLFASPKYLKKNGAPKHPKELEAHTCFQMLMLGNKQWHFNNGKQSFNYECTSDYKINDFYLAEMMALSHLGIALLPNSFNHTNKKELVHVLPDWTIADRPLYLVYPSHKVQSNKTKAFIEVAFEMLRGKI